MSYLLVFAGLAGITYAMDMSLPLACGLILVGMTVWTILMNRKLHIPKW